MVEFDSLFMSNYATINLVNELARLPGVGNVNKRFRHGQNTRCGSGWIHEKMYVLGLVPQGHRPTSSTNRASR